MVGPLYDCLANPLGAVRSTFQKAVASGSEVAIFDGRDWGATDLFREFLSDNGGLSQNEEIWRTNKFTDVSQFPMDLSSDMRIWERRLLYCVPVPGMNSWTESSTEVVLTQNTNWPSPQREKRQREDDAAIDDMDMQVSDHELQGSPQTKRMREGGYLSPSSHSQEFRTDGTCPTMSMALDFGRNSLPCLVKVYDSPEADLKLNDVFEFVGVLTFDPELTADKEDPDELENSFQKDESTHLPPSKVPRLHCLIHRKLAVHDFLSNSPIMEPKSNLVKEMREALLGHLTAVLGNDGLAARFMLLHLLSRVHARVDTLAVGKLSLNLTCFNKESVSVFGNRLNLAVKNLLPFTHCIPLTINYLNTTSLGPKKDYQTNRLVPGVLQLAEGSHLTIDETQLQAGTLDSVGIENARLLKNLVELQKVEYDFKYYKMEMATDVQLLILSEGKSNILPADLVLPFCPSSVGSHQIFDAEALKAWRWYLASLRSLPHSIEPEMLKVVEDDLVAARQADRSLGSQDFNRLVAMGIHYFRGVR
ncbi:hypothetical protein U1Q18_026345 [Sarracenia purpurea var. burkii]